MNAPRAVSRPLTAGRWHLAGLSILLMGLAGPPLRAAVVHPPPGYDFTYAALGECESVETFCAMTERSLAHPEAGSDYGLALAQLTLGLVRNEPSEIGKARALFRRVCAGRGSSKERQLAAAAVDYVGSILSGQHLHATGAAERVVPVRYAVVERAPADVRKIVIGTSAIHVKRGARIKTQVDRVVRDWLGAFNVGGAPGDLSTNRLFRSHEGARVADLAALTGATVIPVWGTRARRVDESWYAPDADGVYRFEISEDKVWFYPTGIVVDDRTALINDTHGISAIAWDSLDADLVVGCGDHGGKMDAAYYLAERGVNVYVPTDRFLHRLIGTRCKGEIIGSAPVKPAPDGAVIGDQPIVMDANETVVVSTSVRRYPLQYYDTPLAYFTALAKFVRKPLNIVPVEVTEYGRADVVVDAARQHGATLIGIRVKSKREHDAVAAWLKEDEARRAVLFHTAAYPDGHILFSEFPRQTSFGDIHPRFE